MAVRLPDALTMLDTWLTAESATASDGLDAAPPGAGPDDDEVVLRLSGVRALRGVARSEVRVVRSVVVEATRAGDGVLLLGGSADTGFMPITARLGPSGPSFVGSCLSAGSGKDFASLASSRRAKADTANGLLRTLVTDPRGEAARELAALTRPTPNRPDWAAVDRMSRSLDPEAVPRAPDAVMQRTRRVLTSLAVPKSWAAYPYSVCARVADGWGECTSLASAATAEGSSQLVVTQRSSATEFWILNDRGEFASRVDDILTLEGHELFDAERLDLTATREFRTVEDFVAAVTSDDDLLAATTSADTYVGPHRRPTR